MPGSTESGDGRLGGRAVDPRSLEDGLSVRNILRSLLCLQYLSDLPKRKPISHRSSTTNGKQDTYLLRRLKSPCFCALPPREPRDPDAWTVLRGKIKDTEDMVDFCMGFRGRMN
jgi:hypothetical protein